MKVFVESTLKLARRLARSDLCALFFQMRLLTAGNETPKMVMLFVSLHIAPLFLRLSDSFPNILRLWRLSELIKTMLED